MNVLDERGYIFTAMELAAGVMAAGADLFTDLPVADSEEPVEKRMADAVLRLVRDGFLEAGGEGYAPGASGKELFGGIARSEGFVKWLAAERLPLYEYTTGESCILLHALPEDPDRFYVSRTDASGRDARICGYLGIAPEMLAAFADVPEMTDDVLADAVCLAAEIDRRTGAEHIKVLRRKRGGGRH